MIPCLDIDGIGSYTPEGFLTACSFDYLDTSSSNYWFIMSYAIVSLKPFSVPFWRNLNVLSVLFCQAAYFLPLIIIAYCYFHILHIVLSAQKIQSSKEKNKQELRLAGIVLGIIGLVCLKTATRISRFIMYTILSFCSKSFWNFHYCFKASIVHLNAFSNHIVFRHKTFTLLTFSVKCSQPWCLHLKNFYC